MHMTTTSLSQRTTKPLVAIVGRPNVGKSTLFNRLEGQRRAVVSHVAGTTRDRVAAEAEWGERIITVVDTGGLDLHPETDLLEKVKSQVGVAIDDADVIIMVVDANTGATAADADVADELRRSEKPVVLAANKADNQVREAQALEFYELGLGEPLPISAYHNRGIDDLMDRVLDSISDEPAPTDPDADFSLAIVGRTNVGKSMLLNAITGQDRAIVSETPGTTRDAIDTLITWNGQSVLLIDTAGIRRSGKIEPGIERYSVLRAIRAIDRADVAVLLMDAAELGTSQDAHVAGYVVDSHRGVVLAINKWDLAQGLGLTRDAAMRDARARLNFVAHAPIRFVSALRSEGIKSLLQTADQVHGQWSKQVPRYGLRRTVMNAVATHPPATWGSHAAKVYGVTQDGARPPSFTFYVNRSDMVHFSYRRYLENAIRREFGFAGSPLRMRFKGRGEE